MNIFFLIIVLTIIPITVFAAQPDNIKEKIAAHETPDNVKRLKQVFDVKEIEKGSSIESADANFSLNSFLGDDCVLILNEPGLNKDEISDKFKCSQTNSVPLTKKGTDALQTRLGNEKFNMLIKSVDSQGIVNVYSNAINLDVSYVTPTYYAKVESGIVTNVIVADSSFVFTQNYVKHDGAVSIGDTFDSVSKVFTKKKQFASWTLENNVWVAPVPYPQDGVTHYWNESTQKWVLFS